MKYVILIHSNAQSREIWESFTEDQRAGGYEYYAGLERSLVDSGELIVSEALADPSTAIQVSVREGRTMTSDGPFAEAKEQLAGFFLLDCESRERAIEIAAQMPEAELGLVEVRAVLDLGGQDM